MKQNALLSAALLAVFSTALLWAGDWPQWLGPNRDGTSSETGLSTTWPAGGPKQLWQRDVGQGFAGPVIAGNRLILFHRLGNKEVVECLQPADGKKLWEYSYDTSFEDSFRKGNGPRSTPLIHGQRVVTLGADGVLTCLDLGNGQKVWQRFLLKEYKVPDSYFGIGTSPIVEQDMVLVNVGAVDAGIVAFKLETGKEVWRATKDQASYSSPVCCTVGGARLAVFLTRVGVVVLDPATGKVHYQKRWRARIDASVNAATPIVAGDLAFISSSYDTGALLLKLRADGADEIWSGDDIMSNHYNTCVQHQGYLYGFDGRQESGPRLRCVELKTGKVQWTKERFGCGSMILVQGHILLLTEQGDLVMMEASPTAYREKARSRVFDRPPCRAQIALADGKLFARDQVKLVCWSLK